MRFWDRDGLVNHHRVSNAIYCLQVRSCSSVMSVVSSSGKVVDWSTITESLMLSIVSRSEAISVW